jgi:cyclomaltodextrinase / maltogenic alpha-amylase / neopullulanase
VSYLWLLAARRGIRVVVDASLNHTGSDSIYFDRFGNFGSAGAFALGKPNPASPYASWYRFDLTQTDPDKQYKYWASPDLPELDESAPGLRAFAFGDADSVTRLWLDRGAAGWRMDVAPWVPDDFWRDWRRAVKAHRPDAVTIAETWFDASKFFLGDMFDTTMNYVFRNAVLDYAAGGKAQDLVAQLEHLREAYPPQAHRALMNLIGSHDVARALHVLGWHDEQADAGSAALAKQRLRLALFLQMTHLGAPMVYYGDEVGMTGGDDPFNRGSYPWPDLGGRPDLALRADYRTLIRLRQDHAVLRRGAQRTPLYVDDHVVVFARRLAMRWALTATNNAGVPATVAVKLPAGAKLRYTDALTGRSVEVRQGRLRLTVPALNGTVLLSR